MGNSLLAIMTSASSSPSSSTTAGTRGVLEVEPLAAATAPTSTSGQRRWCWCWSSCGAAAAVAASSTGSPQLPWSLQLLHAIYMASFQIPSLALLWLVNTHVKMAPQYLPAYSVISFLPYSLRPLMAFASAQLLKLLLAPSSSSSSSGRHDALVPWAFGWGVGAMLATLWVPAGGVVWCFVAGLARGIATGWMDFLLGLVTLECAHQQWHHQNNNQKKTSAAEPVNDNDDDDTHQNDGLSTTTTTTLSQWTASLTAQASTASNWGSFLASIMTMLFFLVHHGQPIGPRTARVLLVSTALMFAGAAAIAFQYSHGVTTTLQQQQETTNRNHVDHDKTNPTTELSIMETTFVVCFQLLLAIVALRQPIEAISSPFLWVVLFVLVTLATLVHVALLSSGTRMKSHKQGGPYRTIPDQQQQEDRSEEENSTSQNPTSDEEVSAVPTRSEIPRISTTNNNNNNTMDKEEEEDRVPAYRLSLFFLLRGLLPTAGGLWSSYLYTVLAPLPLFLQILRVVQTALGIVATQCYHWWFAHWPLRWLLWYMGSLDIVTGLVATLDVLVIAAVNARTTTTTTTTTTSPDDAATAADSSTASSFHVDLDAQLLILVTVVEVTKYFLAELDYLPVAVLSTTHAAPPDPSERGGSDETACTTMHSTSSTEGSEQSVLRQDDSLPTSSSSWLLGNTRTNHGDAAAAPAPAGMMAEDPLRSYHYDQQPQNGILPSATQGPSAVLLPLNESSARYTHVESFQDEYDGNGMLDSDEGSSSSSSSLPRQETGRYSAGMQYAFFISCTDFGFQIGEWITVPLVAWLGVSRTNHWHNLQWLVVIGGVGRMVRCLLLAVIWPRQRRSKRDGSHRRHGRPSVQYQA